MLKDKPPNPYKIRVYFQAPTPCFVGRFSCRSGELLDEPCRMFCRILSRRHHSLVSRSLTTIPPHLEPVTRTCISPHHPVSTSR